MTDSIAFLHAVPRPVPLRDLLSRPGRLRPVHVATVVALLFLAVLTVFAMSEAPDGRATRERLVTRARPVGMRPVAAPDIAALYDPRDIKPLSAPDAIAANAAVPVAGPVGAGAAAFVIEGSEPASRDTALQCLTSALYYEAATEADDGQRAVAQVVLNRMRHPAYPASVCGVVYQGSTRTTGCQFSFTCDGSLARKPSATGWARSRALAQAALSGRVYAPVGHATHYHADYVVPYWAPTLDKLVQVGRHIFYRWTGRAGRAASFNQRYARTELAPVPPAAADIEPPVEPVPAEALAQAPAGLEAAPVVEAPSPAPRAALATPRLEEDRRATPRLLADVEAGRLRQPSGGAARTSAATATERSGDTPQCSSTRAAAPIRPMHDAVPRRLDAPTACS